MIRITHVHVIRLTIGLQRNLSIAHTYRTAQGKQNPTNNRSIELGIVWSGEGMKCIEMACISTHQSMPHAYTVLQNRIHNQLIP